jgi:hypothetical protein
MSTRLPDNGLLAPGAAALAVALEQAAAAVARLDAALLGHPLAARLGLSRPARRNPPSGRGRRPSNRSLASCRARRRGAAAPRSRGAACAIHAWLDQGGERPPLRAALATYWVRRGVTARPCPLLTGAAALAAEAPWTRDLWVGHFLDAVATEAADGLALLRLIERSWRHARHAVAGRRRDSHAAAAIDLLAAALAQLLGIAIKNALRLLDGLVVQGLVSEVTHRSKRRL